MGSESMKLPIINFSNLKQQSETWESVKTQVRQALQQHGCFKATFDHVPLHLRKSLLDQTKQLLDLPLPTKSRNELKRPYIGYVGNNSSMQLYESLAINDVLGPGKLDSFTNLMWPHGNPSFSKVVESFCEQLSELDKIVRRMIVESLGLEKYMDEHLDSTNYLVRVQKYDPQSQETKLGLKPHTDKNFVTILYQNEVNGLELLTDDGDWITVQPSLHAPFVVVTGDALYAWSNGRVRSRYHKVMMSGDEGRYSFGLFSVPKPGYTIEAPEEMVNEEHPLLFKPYDHYNYLDFYYTEAGQKSPAPLREYCGCT